jgi:hypothetical protein
MAGSTLLLLTALAAHGEVLLDEKWPEGSRGQSDRPKAAPVWVGRDADVSTKQGALVTKMGSGSQKIWTYFTDKDPVTLTVGQKLAVVVSFIPRGELSQTTSRSLRIGLFHDPTDPRVETDTNSDAGGSGEPWRDARGYAVQVLVTGDEYTATKPFDLGKRINLESPSLLGTSGDYVKVSGGAPVTLETDKEYTVRLAIERVSENEVELTATYQQGDEEVSSWYVTDDGSYLGTDPVYDKFDLLFIRIADSATTADQIEFTSFKVELTQPDN